MFYITFTLAVSQYLLFIWKTLMRHVEMCFPSIVAERNVGKKGKQWKLEVFSLFFSDMAI